MYYNSLSKIVLLASFFLPVTFPEYLLASGGEDKSKTASLNYSGKQTQEWQEIQAKLLAAKGKLEQQEVLVKGLIESKRATSSGAHGASVAVSDQDKMDTLKNEHQKLLKLIKEYNEIRNQFDSRFPEKTAAPGRIYKRVDPATLEEIESQMTFEGRLRRVERKIREQYPKSATSIKNSKPEDQSNQAGESSKKIKPIQKEVTDPIILQK